MGFWERRIKSMKIASAQNADPAMRRDSVFLNPRLEKNVLAYAAAASAAGVGVLALAPPAAAKVVYTKANQLISPNNIFNLDLNHDGKTDFVIDNRSYVTNYGSEDRIYLNPPVGNSFIGSSGVASALPAGSRVGSGAPFFSGHSNPRRTAGTMVDAGYFLENGSRQRGPWLKAKNRYLGLRFVIQGEAHYGWARLTIEAGTEHQGIEHSTFAAHLTGYAYETIPNKPIVTGRTKGAEGGENWPVSDGSLESGSLGSLARGR
jgi:hypothetical protein